VATKVYLVKRYADMKRDMHLLRALLARIESDKRLDGADGYTASEFEMPNHSAEEVAYHVLLLLDAGFLAGSSAVASAPVIERLTWQGCEFLDDTRDPKIWDAVTKTAKELGGFGISLVLEMAKAKIREQIKLKTGI